MIVKADALERQAALLQFQFNMQTLYLPMKRFVTVSRDSALPCSQSTFARDVPKCVLAASIAH